MRYYPFPDNIVTKALIAVFLTLLLFLTRDTLMSTSIIGFYESQFLMLGLVCVVGVVFLVLNRSEIKGILRDKRLVLILISAVTILFPMFAKQDWQLMYFSVLLCLCISVFLTFFISYRELAKYYIVLLSLLGVYSILAMWVFRPLLIDTGLMSVPVFFNSRDVMFHNFGLSFVSDTFVRTRNFGIFREPGVYQYFLILALFLNNYAVIWKHTSVYWLCNISLAVTMLTTLATGGIAELGLLATVVFFDKKLYRNKRICAVILVCAVLLCLLIGAIVIQKGDLYWELYYMIIGKFKPGEDSSSERVAAIVCDLRLFAGSPLVGEKISTVLYSVANNTTSTMIMFAAFGIFGGGLSILAWLALIWERERKLWVNLALLLIMFLSFNTQNFIADLFFWLFGYMALTERVISKKV